jgi:hypothetical protein
MKGLGSSDAQGGGTQTTFISAFDDRIKAAVPGCYITGFRRLLESLGPQDAEQNVYRCILNGITHADLLEVRAPKPLLISSTTRDFFSIQGAVETFEEVRQAYKAFGREEKAGQAIDDAGHGFFNNITDIYAFFQRELQLPGSHEEEKFDGFPPEDLQVTESGQLITSLGGKLAYDINKEESAKLIAKLEKSGKNPDKHLDNVLKSASEISGFVNPSGEIKSVFRGRYQRDGYSVEMYALHGEGEYIVPLLLFIPKEGKDFSSVIYLHPRGKIVDSAAGGKIEQLVKKGYIVAAPDVIGTGEVEDNSYGSNYLALMIGRSIVGIQAGDVIRVADFLKMRPDIDHDKIRAVAFDEMGPTLLHAAAFNKSVKSVALLNPLVSYQSVVMNKFYDSGMSKYFVAGALTGYDLPDLAATLAPRKLLLANCKNGEGTIIDILEDNKEMDFIKYAYELKNAKENLNITRENNNEIFEKFINWLE